MAAVKHFAAMGGDGVNDAPAPITPAEKAQRNAARVRSRLTAYRPVPVCPDLSREKRVEQCDVLFELCRMVVEDWYHCGPTPQPISNTIINIRDTIMFAAREEMT